MAAGGVELSMLLRAGMLAALFSLSRDRKTELLLGRLCLTGRLIGDSNR
jgi:hypothetical protein